jgi:hypothetical protein
MDTPCEYVAGNPDTAMTLENVYPVAAGRVHDAANILYVARWELLQILEHPPKNVVCAGGGAEAREYLQARGITGIVCPREYDVMAILQEIQDIFMRYHVSEHGLLDALLTNAPLRAVLNACARFFECHMMLFDTEFQLIEYSDNFLPSAEDTIWRDTLLQRRSVVPMIPREKVHMLPSNPADFPRSTFLDIAGVPRHINMAFDSGDSRIATLIFYETGRPLSHRQQWLADYVADVIRPTITENYSTFLGLRNYMRSSVASAIRHSNTDSTFLRSVLSHSDWKMRDYYQLLLVTLPSECRHSSYGIYNYENVFASAYSNCIALHYGDFILILLHNISDDTFRECLPTLERQLTLDDAICCVGMPFCDFSQIKVQYDLATVPLRVENTYHHRILYYRDVSETHIIHELSSCFPLRATCHVAAVRLREYDAANGTDFLLTLETYLMNNKSLMTASNKLYIHRSTMTYRLKCIEKLVSMRLDDPNDRLHLLLSCIALRVLDSGSHVRETATATSATPATSAASIRASGRG